MLEAPWKRDLLNSADGRSGSYERRHDFLVWQRLEIIGSTGAINDVGRFRTRAIVFHAVDIKKPLLMAKSKGGRGLMGVGAGRHRRSENSYITAASRTIQASVLFAIAAALWPHPIHAQSASGEVQSILSREIQPKQAVTLQLQQYLLKREPTLPALSNSESWSAQADKIRTHVLEDVVFHGWPRAWVASAPRFENLGEIPGGEGFRRWKLRYEVVPGLDATAVLYAPEPLHGMAPAILVVMGHWLDRGNTMEFNQKQCINYALRGAVVLNPNWIGMGELDQKGNEHYFGAHLDLVGANGVGLFYLAMRRCLDYLCQIPHVDVERIGMTGLSGGGWQTIVLSSLDKRIRAAIPVAGYTRLAGRVERLTIGEPGDIEQNPTDFLVGQDYSTLTAMRAPRPTLLLGNTEDDCCFRAPLIKPEIYDPIRPFFALYGAANDFEFHANWDDPAHNYGLDNRQQSYGFFIKYLGLFGDDREIQVGEDIKTYGELTGAVPKNNLTILELAKQLGRQIPQEPIPSDSGKRADWVASERGQLRTTIRYQPVTVDQAWPVWNTWNKRLESISYRFQMSNGLSATGVWMREISTPNNAPLTIELNDDGNKVAGAETWNRVPEIADRIDRGEQVVVFNTLLTGDAAPEGSAYLIAEMLAAVGDRPLGDEAAQTLALTHWTKQLWNPSRIRVDTTGIRSQVLALVASALEPGLFSEIGTFHGMHSLSYLLDKPVTYQDAPDLFCLDFYRDFDLHGLIALGEPTKVRQESFVEELPRPE